MNAPLICTYNIINHSKSSECLVDGSNYKIFENLIIISLLYKKLSKPHASITFSYYINFFLSKALISPSSLVILQFLKIKLFALLRKFQTKDYELRTISLPLRLS